MKSNARDNHPQVPMSCIVRNLVVMKNLLFLELIILVLVLLYYHHIAFVILILHVSLLLYCIIITLIPPFLILLICLYCIRIFFSHTMTVTIHNIIINHQQELDQKNTSSLFEYCKKSKKQIKQCTVTRRTHKQQINDKY